MESISAEDRRSKLKNYFKKSSFIQAIITLLVGLFLFSVNGSLGFFVTLFGGVWLYLENKTLIDAPSDAIVDLWLKEDLQHLKIRSLERLNIDESELIQDSLFIKGPILNPSETSIASEDVKWKGGKDGKFRASAYYVNVIHLTEHKLSSYQCNYNFIRGVPVRENDDEYFYKDVVSVSTKDITIDSIELSANQFLRTAQVFLLIVPGSKVEVRVNYPELKDYTGGSIMDTSQVDDAVKAIRKVLLEKKI
jgi:hypothetical protein